MFSQSLSFLSYVKGISLSEVFLPFTLSGPQDSHIWNCAITCWSLYGNIFALCLSLVQLSSQPLSTMSMYALQYKVYFYFSLLNPSTAMPSLTLSSYTVGVTTKPSKILAFCSPQLSLLGIPAVGIYTWFRTRTRMALGWLFSCHVALPCASLYELLVFPLTLGVQELGQGQQGKIAGKKY